MYKTCYLKQFYIYLHIISNQYGENFINQCQKAL